jgi:hypothetical protein
MFVREVVARCKECARSMLAINFQAVLAASGWLC